MISHNPQINVAKDSAAKLASTFVQEGMTIGLGTGSTASYFIAHLIELHNKGLAFQVIATSHQSLNQAKAGGLEIANIEEMSSIDLTVDGADQIDPQMRAIKGGGAALLKEKIVANMSRNLIIIVDETKCVSSLKGYFLPVEIIPFAYKATLYHLEKKGYKGSMRMTPHHNLLITENHHYIVDLKLTSSSLSEAEQEIRSIPGVVETGLFLNLIKKVIIGYTNGDARLMKDFIGNSQE